MSTTDPKLEKSDIASDLSVAPTVQTEGSEAGEEFSASWDSLPAATARKTPALTRAAAASFTAVDFVPPRDMLATAPLGQSAEEASEATKSMPAMTAELDRQIRGAYLRESWVGGACLLAARALGVEDLDAEEGRLLGHTVGGTADGAGHVGAVAVAVSVVAVPSEVLQECGAAAEVLVLGVDARVNDVGAGALAGRGVVGVGAATGLLGGEAGETPGGPGL